MNTSFFLLRWFVRMNRVLLIFFAVSLLLMTLGGFLAPGMSLFFVAVGSSLIAWVLGVAIIVRTVLYQPYLSSDSFWRSRPFTRLGYFMGQFLFVFLFIALPVLLVMFIHVWSYGGIAQHWSSAFSHWVFYAGTFFAVFSAAVHSRGFMGVLGLIGLTFLALMILALFCESVLEIRPVFEEWTWNWIFPGTALAVTLLALLPDRLLKLRRGLFISSLGSVALVVSFLVTEESKLVEVDEESPQQVIMETEQTDRTSQRSGYFSIANDDPMIVLQPQRVTIHPSKDEIVSMETTARYYSNKEGRLSVGNALTLLRGKYPQDSRFFEAGGIDRNDQRNPFSEIIIRSRGESPERVYHYKLDNDSPAELIARRYQLIEVPPLPLDSAAVTTGGGVKIAFDSLDVTATSVTFRSMITRHTSGPFVRSDHTTGAMIWILYSPSRKAVMMSDIERWYFSDDYAGPALRVSSVDYDFNLNTEFTGATDLEIHPHFFTPLEEVVLPITVKAGEYLRSKDWDHDRRQIQSLVKGSEVNDPKLITAVREMNEHQLAGFSMALRNRTQARKIPVSLILKISRKYREFSGVLEHHPDEKAVIEGCAAWLRESDEILHPIVVAYAARAEDRDLIPKLLRQFEAMTYRPERLLYQLREMEVSEEVLRPLILRNWRKGRSRLNLPAAVYGELEAFRAGIEQWEESHPNLRIRISTFNQIKALLVLSDEQKSWPDAKLALWISANAFEMKFDPAVKKYRRFESENG